MVFLLLEMSADECSKIGQSITGRFDGEFLEGGAEVGVVAVAEVTALDHQDANQLLLRVDPALRPPGTAVTKRARRKHLGHALRFADDAPAEAPTVAGGEASDKILRLNASHLLDGGFGNDAFAVEFAAVQDHLIEPTHVARRGEESAG